MALRLSVSKWILPALAASVAWSISTARAAISASGDLAPANPAAWTTSTNAYIGNNSTATLLVNGSTTLYSYLGDVGNNSGSTGTVTVDGPSASWASTSLNVGYSGSGTLNLTNGGAVTVAGATYVGYNQSSTGTIAFGSGGGALTSQSLYATPTQLQGTGTINTRGLVSDIALVFDTIHGPTQTLTINSTGQNVTVNLDLTGASGPAGDLGAGYNGTGTLTVQNAVALTSANGYLGYSKAATGTATVDGTGSFWTTTGTLNVGYAGAGTLNITNGGQVTNSSGILGNNAGSTGTVTVDGLGSTWNSTNSLYVGYSGTGTLNISNGATVTVASIAYVTGPAGTIVFGPGGGTLSSRSLYALPSQLQGTGTINTRGLVSDIDLVFDATHGASQSLTVNSATLNLDLTGAVGDLGVGYRASHSMTISNAVAVTSVNGFLGYYANAAGTATIDGAGSTWTNTATLNVGYFGKGTLNVTHGGHVASAASYVGYYNAQGVATVDGAGSSWSNTGALTLGYTGSTGTLNIAHGGLVTAASLSISSGSLLAIDVGSGSSLNLGAGTLANKGAVQLKAAPGALAGVYTPITAGTWSGAGTIQAFGGAWNSTAHTFTIAPAASGTQGQPVTIDPSQTQRVLFTDPVTGADVQASFQAATTSSNLIFNATTLSGGQETLLASDLTSGWAVLNGWTFTATGYTAGTPVYLSLDVGPGYAVNELAVWHYDGSIWTPYTPTDLTYDGTHANFTVTGFSGYAVAAVPEPATLTLLTLAASAILARRKPWHTRPAHRS